MTPTRTAALAAALATALAGVDRNREAFPPGVYPEDTAAGGAYELRRRPGRPDGTNSDWTTSFWPGQLWLAAQVTGDRAYHDEALAHVASYTERLDQEVDLETHDLGFLFSLACVNAARLADSSEGREAALRAADHLMVRYLPVAGIIQAWGRLDDPELRGRTIVDSLMNTPLLYWASETTGDPRYAEAATIHAGHVRDQIVRPDGTTFHTFYWDAETGEPLRGATAQGSGDDTCWARGQAWAIYGFALVHRHTGDASMLDASRRCADRYLEMLPEDLVPAWDLALGTDPTLLRDTSAAAITASGLLELADALERAGDHLDDAARYRAAAAAMLESLAAHYALTPGERPAPLLREAVYDLPRGVGVDEGNLWGDYYYLEALARLTTPDLVSAW